MKNFLTAAIGIAQDKVADSNVSALQAAAAGAPLEAAAHIGQAACDIIELSNLVHEVERED